MKKKSVTYSYEEVVNVDDESLEKEKVNRG